MAARRKRDSKGRFVKGGGGSRRRRSTKRKTTKRRATARRAPAKRKTTRRRRTTRRNPPLRNALRTLQDGLMGGAEVVLGKAAARVIPTTLGLPKQGNVGLAVQIGVATTLAVALDFMGLGRDHVGYIAAGAFSAPLETLAVAHNVPLLAAALHPTAQAADLQGYFGVFPRTEIPERGVSSYYGTRRYAGGRSTMPMA